MKKYLTLALILISTVAFSQVKEITSGQPSKVEKVKSGGSINLNIQAYTIAHSNEKNEDGSLDSTTKWAQIPKIFSEMGSIISNGKIHTLMIKVGNAKVDSSYTLRLKRFPKSGENGVIVFKNNHWKNGTILINEKYFQSSGYYDIEVAQDGNISEKNAINPKSISGGYFGFKVLNPG
jgi:hypothetical protein